MRGSELTAGIAATALTLAAGCASHDVLVFSTETTVGIALSNEPAAAEGPVSGAMTIGYKRREAAWLPLFAASGDLNDASCKVTLEQGKAKEISCPPDRHFTGTTNGKDRDAYSVFASFGADVGGFVRGKAALAQFFATGVAAQRLAENASVRDALSLQPEPPAKESAALETWNDLTVAAERRCSTYRPNDYKRQNVTVAQVARSQDGKNIGPFEAVQPDSKTLVIGRFVAPSEAHDSGLCAAGDEARAAFRSDVQNFVLMTKSTSSSKGARDAAEWTPDKNECWFAQRVVEIRQQYALTIDPRERNTLDGILANCNDDFSLRTPPN